MTGEFGARKRKRKKGEMGVREGGREGVDIERDGHRGEAGSQTRGHHHWGPADKLSEQCIRGAIGKQDELLNFSLRSQFPSVKQGPLVQQGWLISQPRTRTVAINKSVLPA